MIIDGIGEIVFVRLGIWSPDWPRFEDGSITVSELPADEARDAPVTFDIALRFEQGMKFRATVTMPFAGVIPVGRDVTYLPPKNRALVAPIGHVVFSDVKGDQSASAGAIAGTIRDESAEPVMGAIVVASGSSAEGAGLSDRDGHFSIPNLPPGEYVLRFFYEEFSFESPRGMMWRSKLRSLRKSAPLHHFLRPIHAARPPNWRAAGK